MRIRMIWMNAQIKYYLPLEFKNKKVRNGHQFFYYLIEMPKCQLNYQKRMIMRIYQMTVNEINGSGEMNEMLIQIQ